MCEPYPKDILPRSTYRHYMRTGMLLRQYPGLFVARCFDGDEKDIFVKSENGLKKELEVNKVGNLYGWSVNLCGGLFDCAKHSKFNPKLGRVIEGWNGKYDIPAPIYENDYTIKNGKILDLYFNVRDIHLVSLPYLKTINESDFQTAKKKAIKIAEDFKIIVQGTIVGEFQGAANKQTSFTGRTMLNHHPTDLNYWHFQIDTYRGTDLKAVVDGDKPKGERDKIKRALRSLLSKAYQKEQPVKYNINRKYYQRSISCAKVLWDNCIDLRFKYFKA